MHWKKSGALIVLACAVVALALMLPGVATAKKSIADTILTNGFVYTVENHGNSQNVDTAQAVAILDGKIIFVGTNAAAKKYIGPHTKVVDVHGKMVMPGLEDGHFHGQGFVACDMGYSGGTEDQILQKIHDALLREDQAPLLKTNDVLDCYYFLSSAMLPAGTVLTRDMLDRLSLPTSSGDSMATGTTRPIVVHEADFHKFYTNSTAIDNAGITAATVAPGGSFIGHYGADAPAPFLPGDPNGAFSDYTPPQPFGDSAPQPADADYLGKLSDLQKLNQAGVTSGWQALGFPSDLPVWKQLADDGKLTVRINQSMFTPWVRGATDPSFLQSQIDVINAARAEYNGYSSPNSPGTLTVDTAKIFADGVAEFPAQTAAMLEPYNINVGTAEVPLWMPGILPWPRPHGRRRHPGLPHARCQPLEHPRARDRQPRRARDARQLRRPSRRPTRAGIAARRWSTSSSSTPRTCRASASSGSLPTSSCSGQAGTCTPSTAWRATSIRTSSTRPTRRTAC